jgi:hypothetical protein
MQVSLSERDAEIIRLNLCLGDEKKRNCDLKVYDMPMQINQTPTRLTRSNSRQQPQPQHHHHHVASSSGCGEGLIPRSMVMDSPYF